MDQNSSNGMKGDYVLANGEAAARRLQILHSVYGPGARRVLISAGIKPGMRIADLGCGVGMTTALLADLVGPTGEVVGGGILVELRSKRPENCCRATFQMLVLLRQARSIPGCRTARLTLSIAAFF